MGKALRRYTILLRDLLLAVDIDLRKLDAARLRFFLRERVKHGRDGLARTAPVGIEVDDCVCGGGDELLEMGGG